MKAMMSEKDMQAKRVVDTVKKDMIEISKNSVMEGYHTAINLIAEKFIVPLSNAKDPEEFASIVYNMSEFILTQYDKNKKIKEKGKEKVEE